jgi:acarbose 7IV-phosphotransferase
MRAVVLGGIAWNLMIDVGALPAPMSHTVFASGWREAVGSTGAGKALNLSRLGFTTSLWATIGDDEVGQHAVTWLREQGIDVRTQHDPAGTMRHVNVMAPDGERLSIFLNGGSHELTLDTSFLGDWLAGTDVVWTTIFNPCRQFLPLIASAGKQRWIDIHDYDGENPYHAEFFEAADMLFLSSTRLTDHRRFMAERVEAGARVAVCTHGAHGATALGRDEGWVDVPAVAVEAVVDVNGAGDAFSSGFAAAWLAGRGLEAAMHAGAVMGAAAVQSPALAPDACPPELSGLIASR